MHSVWSRSTRSRLYKQALSGVTTDERNKRVACYLNFTSLLTAHSSSFRVAQSLSSLIVCFPFQRTPRRKNSPFPRGASSTKRVNVPYTFVTCWETHIVDLSLPPPLSLVTFVVIICLFFAHLPGYCSMSGRRYTKTAK